MESPSRHDPDPSEEDPLSYVTVKPRVPHLNGAVTAELDN